MKLLVQRVKSAEVRVANEKISGIRNGLLVYIGIKKGDTENEANFLIKKLINLRIFEDKKGKMNLSVREVNGEIMLISQFTLYADTQRGNRPDFINAAPSEEAKQLYEYFADKLNDEGFLPQLGEFGADMKVESINDGPVNIILEK